jgi:hypothetical protein
MSSSFASRDRPASCHVPDSAMCCALVVHCGARVFVDQGADAAVALGPGEIGPWCTERPCWNFNRTTGRTEVVDSARFAYCVTVREQEHC